MEGQGLSTKQYQHCTMSDTICIVALDSRERVQMLMMILMIGRRRRRCWWWLSLLVKIEGDQLNTQQAQHRSVQATDR